MNATARLRLRPRHGFVAVVVAAYVSALSSIPERYAAGVFTPSELALMASCGLLYLLAGVYGFALCQRRRSRALTLLYFAAQLTLSAVVMFQTWDSLVGLMLLPLAGQAVVLLPAPLAATVAVAVALTTILPFLWQFGFGSTVRVGGAYDQPSWLLALRWVLIYSAGIVFVVVFTRIAAGEREGRAEVERLAAELREANGKLREYAAQAGELAAAKERNRLAREIHDSLGHYLTVVNVQLEAARALFTSDPARALEGVGKAQRLTQEGLGEVRRSVAAMRAAPTEGRTLAEALAALVADAQTSGTRAELRVVGRPRALTPQAELTLYRAAQEALTNIRRHAQATRADVTLDYGDARPVRLTVRDDGVGRAAPARDAAGDEPDGAARPARSVDHHAEAHGINADEASAARRNGEGFGLLGLRERAQLLGGRVRVVTDAGRGFTLELELPL